MTVRTATGSVDDVTVTQVLEEARQTQCVHTARDDWGSWLHTVPFLIVDRPLALVTFNHVRDDFVIGTAFHFAEAHSADVDTGSTLQT